MQKLPSHYILYKKSTQQYTGVFFLKAGGSVAMGLQKIIPWSISKHPADNTLNTIQKSQKKKCRLLPHPTLLGTSCMFVNVHDRYQFIMNLRYILKMLKLIANKYMELL